MTKSLIQRVKEGALLIAAVSFLGFATCKLNNYPTIADLKVSPTSGQPPLFTSINLNGSNGENNVKEYKIEIDRNQNETIDEVITSPYPINIGRQFKVNTDIYGETTDFYGNINRIKQTVTVDNYPPTAIFNACRQEDTLDIIVNLEGADLNGKEDIIEYNAGIDGNCNDILEDDEVKITQNSPIVNGIIPADYGTFNVIGECVDSQGAVGRGEKEVIISENSQPVPVANLTVSAISGYLPLEDLVSLDGSVTDATTVKYEIGADINNNNQLDAEEIITSSDSAITNKEIIFIKPGTYNICGQVTDSNGNIGKARQEVNISSRTPNLDLTETMQFPDTYNAGSKFTFIGQVNNTTSPYTSVTLDNSLGDSLKYKLIKEKISGIGEGIIENKLEEKIKISLKQSGYLKLDLKNNDMLNLTLANADVTYNGMSISIGSPFTYSQPHQCDILPESGNYYAETIIKYFINNNPQTFIFLSDFFVVN